MGTIRDIKELKEVAKKACNLFLKECKTQGVDIFITETFRSQTRQNELYAKGRTTPGDIVTWTKTSNHTGRMAWDIASRGNNLYDINVLKKAGKIAESLGITWGGSWKPADMPHFEVKNGWNAPKENNMERFKTLEELPSWAKDSIEKLVKEKKIADENNLDLSLDMIRLLVILNR